MSDEQKQILEAVTRFRTETDTEFEAIREAFKAMLLKLEKLEAGNVDLLDKTAALELSLKVAHQQIANLESEKAIMEKLHDGLVGQVAALETLTHAGGMAVQELRNGLTSLQDGLYAVIRERVGLEAVSAVEAYVAERKKAQKSRSRAGASDPADEIQPTV